MKPTFVQVVPLKILKKLLMVIVPLIRTSPRPFSFVIFTTDFLADRRVDHINKPKEKTAQMGQVGDTTSCPFCGREEFDQTEYDNHVFGRNGKEKVDIDHSIGKEPSKSKEYSVNGP